MQKDLSRTTVTPKHFLTLQHPLFTFLFSGWFPALVKILAVLLLMFYILYALKQVPSEPKKTSEYIASPKIGDIYFINYPLLEKNARPSENFRIAKLVDITANILTFQYGNLFYVSQNAAEKGIEFGHMRYSKYLEPKRYNFSLTEVAQLHNDNIFYRVERPVYGKLYGNFVSPQRKKLSAGLYIPGKTENNAGEAHLMSGHLENHLQLAFDYFTQSAKLNNPVGQTNLAQMYIDQRFIEKDFQQSLYWLKQASLQSYKPAILKYVIVCQQVSSCDEIEFYQELQTAGVAIKVRSLSNKINIE